MGNYAEAPMLAAKVKAGQLPPVIQRLPAPEDVYVEKPIEKVGKYGGTINVFALDNLPWNDFQWGCGLSDGLHRMTKDASGLKPNLAKGYELSADAKAFTIYLRKGVKWSDGVPLTADVLGEGRREDDADIPRHQPLEEALNQHMVRAGVTTFCDEMSNWTQGSRIFASHGDIINFANAWDRWYDATSNIKSLQAKLAVANTDDEKNKIQDSLKTYQDALASAVKDLPDGKQPPADRIQLNDWFSERNKLIIGSAKYKELSQKIYDWHAKNLWIIGTVGMIPQPFVVSSRLHNAITPD